MDFRALSTTTIGMQFRTHVYNCRDKGTAKNLEIAPSMELIMVDGERQYILKTTIKTLDSVKVAMKKKVWKYQSSIGS